MRREEVMEVKEEWLYLDSGPRRRWRAAAPGRLPPPEAPCASSSAPAAQTRIREAARKTEGPVRTGRSAESRKTFTQTEIPRVDMKKSGKSERRHADYRAAKIK